ncbi:MAG: hypothetical protein DMG13_23375 [Acidobacteria bacterium]|nr:MAG: hypothetical protein DMG13_23375 [Acidobacteriota bacterium]
MTKDAMFRIMSMTKPVVGVADPDRAQPHLGRSLE